LELLEELLIYNLILAGLNTGTLRFEFVSLEFKAFEVVNCFFVIAVCQFATAMVRFEGLLLLLLLLEVDDCLVNGVRGIAILL